MITLKDVCFQYSADSAVQAVRHVNLTIQDGECIVLTGESGCGKTTLTRCINGLVPNFYEGELTGELLLDGKNLLEMAQYEISVILAQYFKIHVPSFLQWIPQMRWLLAVKTYP